MAKRKCAMMKKGYLIDIQGEEACWSICKGERVSYDVPTPTAICGLVESILWKPAIRWVVDEIHAIDIGRPSSERRNEIEDFKIVTNKKTGKPNPFKTIQVNSLIRKAFPGRKLHYRARIHFEMTAKAGERDSFEKFNAMFLRRIRGGESFDRPYLGLRHCPAEVGLIEDESKMEPTLRLTRSGRMLLSFDRKDPKSPRPMFFSANMIDGVISVPDVVIQDSREVV